MLDPKLYRVRQKPVVTARDSGKAVHGVVFQTYKFKTAHDDNDASGRYVQRSIDCRDNLRYLRRKEISICVLETMRPAHQWTYSVTEKWTGTTVESGSSSMSGLQ